MAGRRQSVPKAVAIFTDAQSAIRQATGPAQKYAPQARKWIANLRAKNPNIRIEIRWCPTHSGVPGNEKAGRGARQTAEEPDA